MLWGKGKFWRTDKKLYIYVPVQVATDSAFPFPEENGYVDINIEGEKLVITKHEEEE